MEQPFPNNLRLELAAKKSVNWLMREMGRIYLGLYGLDESALEDEQSPEALGLYVRYPDPSVRHSVVYHALREQSDQVYGIRTTGFEVLHNRMDAESGKVLSQTLQTATGRVWKVTYDQNGNIQRMLRTDNEPNEDILSFVRD